MAICHEFCVGNVPIYGTNQIMFFVQLLFGIIIDNATTFSGIFGSMFSPANAIICFMFILSVGHFRLKIENFNIRVEIRMKD